MLARTSAGSRRLAALVGVLVVSGCSQSSGQATSAQTTPSGPPVLASRPDPTPAGATATQCRSVMAAVPATVSGRQRTRLTASTAEWGDPGVVLRCGVAKPSALAPDSRCDGVNGVGWLTEEGADGWRFTTIGRAGYIEVDVPAQVTPPSDALVDLSAAVSRMKLLHPCV